MKNQIKFSKGIVEAVVDKNQNSGINILLTPEDIKEFATPNGYVPVSIRLGKDGKYYAYKATQRIAPIKTDIVDDFYDLAKISVEEAKYQDLDAVSESLHQNEYKESVHINDIIKSATEQYINNKK